MNEMSISDIKNVSLDILIAIDDFCRKKSINCSLSGGTALWGDITDLSHGMMISI